MQFLLSDSSGKMGAVMVRALDTTGLSSLLPSETVLCIVNTPFVAHLNRSIKYFSYFFQDGYRYILAEQDSNAPLANMDMEFWAGKPIPGDLYRIKLHKEVLLSMNDRGL